MDIIFWQVRYLLAEYKDTLEVDTYFKDMPSLAISPFISDDRECVSMNTSVDGIVY